MGEIILSFFAVIGITFLALRICDYLFFRNFQHFLSLIVDLRGKSEAETVEILELITSVGQSRSGRAVLSDLIVVVPKEDPVIRQIANHYMTTFHLSGKIYSDGDLSWQERY